MHTNSVAYNPELDQIMLSIHEFSEVWIIDHSTTTEEAASHTGGRRGKGGDLLYRWGNPRAYRYGHATSISDCSPNTVPTGFPPDCRAPVTCSSSTTATDVPTACIRQSTKSFCRWMKTADYVREEFVAFGPDRATWSYTAAEKPEFFSMLISGAQRLPNGNTYICSGNPGIVFEVTSANDLVWEYATPNREWRAVRARRNGTRRTAARIPAGHAASDGRSEANARLLQQKIKAQLDDTLNGRTAQATRINRQPSDRDPVARARRRSRAAWLQATPSGRSDSVDVRRIARAHSESKRRRWPSFRRRSMSSLARY